MSAAVTLPSPDTVPAMPEIVVTSETVDRLVAEFKEGAVLDNELSSFPAEAAESLRKFFAEHGARTLEQRLAVLRLWELAHQGSRSNIYTHTTGREDLQMQVGALEYAYLEHNGLIKMDTY